MVEITQRILTAEIDSAGVVKCVPQHGHALLVEDFAGDDLHADRQILELGAGLAER